MINKQINGMRKACYLTKNDERDGQLAFAEFVLDGDGVLSGVLADDFRHRQRRHGADGVRLEALRVRQFAAVERPRHLRLRTGGERQLDGRRPADRQRQSLLGQLLGELRRNCPNSDHQLTLSDDCMITAQALSDI